jgi:IclR family transcriptional regulator, acetate operon repressor
VSWSSRPFYPTLGDVARGGATGTSTIRALRVVEAVAAAGDGVTAKVIARRVGVPLPSVYRALGLLVQEGYLVRLHEVRGYGLGYRLGQLHRCLTDQVRPPAPVRAVLHDVHTSLGAAAYLAVLRDTDVVVAHVDDCAAHPRPAPLRVGEPTAAHATAVGKALLADLPLGRAAELIAHLGMPRLTERTLADRAALTKELIRVRTAGAAVELEEFQLGTAAIAAPVPGPHGPGALGVSLPSADFAARREELERGVREAAARAVDGWE